MKKLVILSYLRGNSGLNRPLWGPECPDQIFIFNLSMLPLKWSIFTGGSAPSFSDKSSRPMVRLPLIDHYFNLLFFSMAGAFFAVVNPSQNHLNP
ncbi:MAG: hypothetical protein WA081_18130 [Desulfosalsimonadaceae bacterium]